LSKICAAAQEHQRVVDQPGLGEDNTGSDVGKPYLGLIRMTDQTFSNSNDLTLFLLTSQMAHSVTDLFARAREGDEMHQKEIVPLKKALARET